MAKAITPVPKNITTKTIVLLNKNFSAPLFALYISLDPPNIPDNPDPLCCIRITMINNKALTNCKTIKKFSIIFKLILIPLNLSRNIYLVNRKNKKTLFIAYFRLHKREKVC